MEDVAPEPHDRTAAGPMSRAHRSPSFKKIQTKTRIRQAIVRNKGKILSFTRSWKPDKSMLRVTSGRFRPEIDGLRFFAIIPVLFSHLFEWVLRHQAEQGFATAAYGHFVNHLPGVLLFFAISGYILNYQITNASRDGYNWKKYQTYILRRFKRIAPPYYILLFFTFFVVGMIGFRPNVARHFDASNVPLFSSLIASLLYCHWFIFGEFPRLFGAAWTLEIETQYYVIAPLLTLLYLRIRSSKIKLLVGIIIVALTSIAASQLYGTNFWSATILKYFPYFFTGMLALEMQRDLRNAFMRLPTAALDALAAAAVFLYFWFQPAESGGGREMLIYFVTNITCVMIMFVNVSIEGTALRRICVNNYVVMIGGACYSIYLTHGQIIYLIMNFLYQHVRFPGTASAMIANALIEAPIAILVGLTFYRFIEKPFMVWGRNSELSKPHRTPAAEQAR